MDILAGFDEQLVVILKGVVPLIVLFVWLQIFYLKLPARYVLRLLSGIALASLGLVLFLHGIQISLLPVGSRIGEAIGVFEPKWVVALLGPLLGFTAAFCEPSIRILAAQAEEITGGYIRDSVVVLTISAGVALSASLGMLKLVYGFPLWYIIVPGYLGILVLMWVSDENLVPLAFDAGGVATGPVPAVFLSALALGMASVIDGRHTIADGLGLVALVVMAPVASMLFLGLFYRISEQKGSQ